jgi:hypothetical protein
LQYVVIRAVEMPYELGEMLYAVAARVYAAGETLRGRTEALHQRTETLHDLAETRHRGGTTPLKRAQTLPDTFKPHPSWVCQDFCA